MSPFKKTLAITAGTLLVATVANSHAAAQCSRGGGMSTGSPTAMASNRNYSQNPLALGGYSQTNLAAMQYQQRALAARQQVADVMYQNGQRQRLAMTQREAQARPYRLARAEANRAARAERIAARLRAQGRSSDDYLLTSATAD